MAAVSLLTIASLTPHTAGCALRSVSPGAGRGRALVTMRPEFRPSIIVYTKRDCPLCDGLASNLEAIQQHVDFALSKRFIEERAEWEELYRYEVPVLVGIGLDGAEMPIPRPSPRAAGAFLMKWLRKHYFEKLALLADEGGAGGAAPPPR